MRDYRGRVDAVEFVYSDMAMKHLRSIMDEVCKVISSEVRDPATVERIAARLRAIGDREGKLRGGRA